MISTSLSLQKYIYMFRLHRFRFRSRFTHPFINNQEILYFVSINLLEASCFYHFWLLVSIMFFGYNISQRQGSVIKGAYSCQVGALSNWCPNRSGPHICPLCKKYVNYQGYFLSHAKICKDMYTRIHTICLSIRNGIDISNIMSVVLLEQEQPSSQEMASHVSAGMAASYLHG